MSQKKKLVLSPLPEQTDDYSRYEETETRWDRIIAALVLLVLVISVLVYLLISNTDNESDLVVLKSAVPIEQVAPTLALENNLGSEPVVSMINQDKLIDEENLNALQTDLRALDAKESLEQATISDSKLSESLPIGVRAEQESEQASEQALPHELSAKKSSVVNIVANESPKIKKAAAVSIKNTSITRAVLTLEMKNDEPVSSLSSELVMPEEGIVKVMLFTEMDGLRGTKLYHEWYRNGVRQARVKIPVNAKNQSSHSSKYINAQMLGEWQVKVVDEKSALYVLADFRVVLP